jgi:hypothetical protein
MSYTVETHVQFNIINYNYIAAAYDGADWRVIAYDREKWKEVVLAVKIFDGS